MALWLYLLPAASAGNNNVLCTGLYGIGSKKAWIRRKFVCSARGQEPEDLCSLRLCYYFTIMYRTVRYLYVRYGSFTVLLCEECFLGSQFRGIYGTRLIVTHLLRTVRLKFVYYLISYAKYSLIGKPYTPDIDITNCIPPHTTSPYHPFRTDVDYLHQTVRVRTATYNTVLKELNPAVSSDIVLVLDNAIPSHTVTYGNYTVQPHIIPTRTVAAIVTAINPIPTHNNFPVQSYSEQSLDLKITYHSHRKFPIKNSTRQLPSCQKPSEFLQNKAIHPTVLQNVHTSSGNSPSSYTNNYTGLDIYNHITPIPSTRDTSHAHIHTPRMRILIRNIRIHH